MPHEEIIKPAGPPPPPQLSPTESASPAPEAPQAPRNARLVESASPAQSVSPAESAIHLWQSLTELKGGNLHLPNAYIDDLCPHLDPSEQAVYNQLYRLSWGYGNPSCRIALPNLAKRAGMKPTATHEAVKRLEKKGMIEKRSLVLGKGKEQGVEFWLPLPASLAESIRLARSARHAKSEPIKEKEIKKDSKGEVATLCEKCKETGGFLYPNGIGGGGVVKCKHGG